MKKFLTLKNILRLVLISLIFFVYIYTLNTVLGKYSIDLEYNPNELTAEQLLVKDEIMRSRGPFVDVTMNMYSGEKITTYSFFGESGNKITTSNPADIPEYLRYGDLTDSDKSKILSATMIDVPFLSSVIGKQITYGEYRLLFRDCFNLMVVLTGLCLVLFLSSIILFKSIVPYWLFFITILACVLLEGVSFVSFMSAMIYLIPMSFFFHMIYKFCIKPRSLTVPINSV